MSSTVLYLGSLPDEHYSDAAVRELCTPYGTIVRVYVPKRRPGYTT
ncbi:hypothetical protein KIPB_011806, partial [Kipferlia bialata]|eukprot:g11806.t1